MTSSILSSSFRDPSGFLFIRDGILYRQVNARYKKDYDMLMDSGLYETLTDADLLVRHDEVSLDLRESDDAYKIIRPDVIPFISYPYEWSFSQLKDAALLTLEIQKLALEHKMSLKDASAYNIQFANGKPAFIDTLSFEVYKEGEPWVAYRQFCQHFLAPLVLMKNIDAGFNRWLRVCVDGLPIELASRLAPWSTRFRPGLLMHIHLHAKSQRHFSGKAVEKKKARFSKFAMLGIVSSLESAVKSQKWVPGGTEWGEYYSDTNYSTDALSHKKAIISDMLDKSAPALVWDLGANQGLFSRIASDKGIRTISFDIDPACVEINYLEARKKGEANILPLLLDATNPSPDLGWNNKERMSLVSRGPCDTLMALALAHHLAISNNIPLPKIASHFGKICKSLIIEWVPKEDSQVQRLLATREDIFDSYTVEHFEAAFGRFFEAVESQKIRESGRTLYLMRKKLHAD